MALTACSSSENTENITLAETREETTISEIISESETEVETEITGIISTGMTDLYRDAFLPFADKLGKITFEEINSVIDALDYTVEKTEPTEDDLGQFKIISDNGDYVWILTYPDNNAETLSAISYDHENGMYEISISDNYHMSAFEFKTYNKNLDTPKSVVSNIEECEQFMFGNTSGANIKDETAEIIKTIENTIKSRIEEKYTNTDIEKIAINDDLGTDTPDDYVALVYLTWNMQNTGKTSKEVLTMYSNDLAAITAEQLPNVQEIAIFWDVPYLNDSAKCAYERKDNAMYESDIVWGNAFSE